MENEIIEKPSLIEKISSLIKEKRKLLLSFLVLIIIILLAVIFYNHYLNNKNEKISEKYIQAGIHLSNENNEKAKIIYKEIVLSKNKFYSILALNNILENNLVENSNEILSLFEIVEDINVKKEQRNLIKLKKALYFKKILRNDEGNKLLKEIIADDSIWKDAAEEISKQ